MCGLKRAFLLLALCVSRCALIKVTDVKKVGRELDAQPVCTRKNMGVILFVSCRISTGRHHGEECRLIPDTKSDCEFDSRFTLMNTNQTVYLGLTGLTPVDSGSYTCECSYVGGTQVFQLEITVEAEEEEDQELIATLVIPLTVASTLAITAGIICAIYCRRKRNREVTRPVTFDLSRCETSEGLESRYTSLNCLDQDEYAGLELTTSDIYPAFSSYLPQHDAEAETNPIDMHSETFTN